jgi:hypothetical protein
MNLSVAFMGGRQNKIVFRSSMIGAKIILISKNLEKSSGVFHRV